MGNLFRGLKPNSKLARNGFDLSQKHVFTTRPGQITPCLALETVPNDHIEINMANLTRTLTLNTAAFIRGKFNFDFYFVPYTQLWHPFNQFVNQRDDKHSANQKGRLYVPTISLQSVLELIAKSLYGSDSDNQNSDDVFGYNWGLNALRLLDMLGYGAYYEIQQFQGIDDQGLITYLRQFANVYVNVFRLAAYQHIWYDIYRNKYFDVESEYASGIVQKHDYVKYFNFDDVDCSDLAGSRITVSSTYSQNDRIFGLFQIRYAQYKKDLFTSLMPSTQFGAVSSIDIYSRPVVKSSSGDGLGNRVLTTYADGNLLVSTAVSSGSGSTPSNWLQTLAYLDMPSAFDVLQLRKAEVLQKWKQLTLRAGNMVDDNWKAHFGTTPRYESDENVMYLGSHSAQLQVNPVEATTAASNQPLGDLGATGTAVAQGDKIVFDLKDNGDYGVIIGLCYFVPENEYNATGIDKANTLYEQFDWFTPEFENIGLEAVSRSNYDFVSHPEKMNDVLGYAPRYWMYKTSLDKVHGQYIDDALITGNTLIPWVAPRHEIFFDLSNTQLKIGTRSLSTFYVNPAQLNNVFGIIINNEDLDTQTQNNDPFLHNVYFDIKAIRPMSVLGLPQF